jgi:methionyl-tRNA formyltransferase
MRIVYIGCVESSEHMLRSVFQVPEANVVGIVTRYASAFNADFRSLAPLAEQHEIPYYFADNNDQDSMAAWIQDRSPEVGFCFGWSYLLNTSILTIPDLGFVGYHPTALPRNRGRHPIIWALALGLAETASSFFFMDEGADTGDLLSQRPVSIKETDDARTLYNRLMRVADGQIRSFAPDLASGEFSRTPQNDTEANHWRKRSKEDGKIDWRMNARSVYNLVRALTHPYPGAHCVFNGAEMKIWASEVVSSQFQDVAHLEPGKVLASDSSRICVKCGEGVVALTDHEFDTLPTSNTYIR